MLALPSLGGQDAPWDDLSWGQEPQELRFLNAASTERVDGAAAGMRTDPTTRRPIAKCKGACEHPPSALSSAAASEPAMCAKKFTFMILDEPLVATVHIAWGAGAV